MSFPFGLQKPLPKRIRYNVMATVNYASPEAAPFLYTFRANICRMQASCKVFFNTGGTMFWARNLFTA
ncbi:hypothetical protein B6U84_01875 [Candidatus Bathyarchaeota archaeon ex4484_40]|nr:MAG: hypothetical protein B6U84_01875 [Candidatus Bathyarchaeota archaeon ex4484_40]